MDLHTILSLHNANPADLVYCSIEHHNGEREKLAMYFDNLEQDRRVVVSLQWYHTRTGKPRKDSDLTVDYSVITGWDEVKQRWGTKSHQEHPERRISTFKKPENKAVIVEIIQSAHLMIQERLKLSHRYSTAAFQHWHKE